MIRHGKTVGNLESRYIGVTDQGLCKEGEEELKHNKKWLELTLDCVYVSPMLRCQQTAEILCNSHFKKEIIDGLKECNFGLFENKNYKDLTGNQEYQTWIDSGGNCIFPNGDDPVEFKKRSVKTFLHIIETATENKYQEIGIVTHGGTIMSIMEALAHPKKDFYTWHVPNGKGYTFFVENGNVIKEVKEI